MAKLYSSAAAEDSAVVSAVPARVDEVIATNKSATDVFLHIFDSATVPANTTAPYICIGVPAGRTVSWDPEKGSDTDKGEPFNSGVAVCLSSTAATKTVTTGSDGVFTVRGSV